jgi:DNA-binding beta-propeller fold protein YncE
MPTRLGTTLARPPSILLLLALLLAACTAPGPATVRAPTPTPLAATPTPLPTSIPAPTAAQSLPPLAPGSASAGAGQGTYGDGGVDLYAQSAPEFPTNLEWLNTGAPLTMAGLRGKIVLVDFWTYGCVNCIHNLPELTRLQAEHPDELVVIGVHSAKFTNEGQTENIRRVIQRYELPYPVVNDNELRTWYAWGARAWPTLVVVDANGVMAALHVGEGAYRVMKPLVVTLIKEADGRGRLNRTPLATLARETRPATLLAFPGKVHADPAGRRLFIADSGNHRIVVADPASGEVLDVFGSGERGLRDGDRRTATFDTPQGMALTADGATLYVADTGNHAVRAVDLASGTVTTLIGSGRRAERPQPDAVPFAEARLSSPWDLALRGTQLYIAMAGIHQVWRANLSAAIVGPYAGDGIEGVADGPLAEAQLAQPSGLAYDGDSGLFLADTESSSVRRIELSGRGAVRTIAGGGIDLFTFGDQDGVGETARLQHPQAVAFADGVLYVADTYNNKIKRVDPATGEVTTLAGDTRGWRDGTGPLFYEPGGIDAAGDTLFVADTNNHVIRTLDIATGTARTLVLKGIERFTASADEANYRGTIIRMDPVTIAPGAGVVQLDVVLPPGYKVNDQAPSSVAWRTASGITALPPDADRSLVGATFPIELPATFAPGSGELVADLTVIYCEAVTPDLCLIDEARLIAPLTVAPGGTNTITLRRTVPPPPQ